MKNDYDFVRRLGYDRCSTSYQTENKRLNVCIFKQALYSPAFGRRFDST